jgi:hypothetical protein
MLVRDTGIEFVKRTRSDQQKLALSCGMTMNTDETK